MSELSMADRLYGGAPTTPGATGGVGSILGGDALPNTPPVTTQKPADESNARGEQDRATSLYGIDGDTGGPLEDYGPVTNGIFEKIDFEGRFNKDEALLEESKVAREQVNGFLSELQVGRDAATETMSLVAQYRETPLSEEAYDQTWANTLNGLKDKYGPEAKKMLAGAERVIADIGKRIPAAKAYMAAGLNVNAQFINRCIQVAKQRGYV